MSRDRWTIAALMLVTCLTLAWPGDIHWGGDQLQLIGRALDLNQSHQLATHGLWGNKGIEYGPTAIWFYQSLLHITHQPITLVLIHAALMLVLTGWSLLWLARLLKIDPLLVAIVLASPHWLFYSRWLWDNTFCLPLSCLLLAAWIDFSRTPALKTFVLILLCGVILPTIHPMSLPLCVAIAIDLLAHSSQWRRYWPAAVAVIAICGLAYWPYIQHLRAGSGPTAGHEMTLAGWLYPFLGARPFSGWRLDTYFFSPQWQQACLRYGGAVLTVAGVGLIAVSWAGIGRVIADRGAGRVRLVLLGTLVAMILIGGLTNAAGFPHYFNGVWPVFLIFVWEGLRTLRLASRPMLIGVLVVNFAMSLAVAISLHVAGGAREIYGPTLANQIEIVHQLRWLNPSHLDVEVPHLQQYPDALKLLNRLVPYRQTVSRTVVPRARIALDAPDSPAGRAHVELEH